MFAPVDSSRYCHFNVFERKQFQKLLSIDEGEEEEELLTLDSPVVKLANFLADLKNDYGILMYQAKLNCHLKEFLK